MRWFVFVSCVAFQSTLSMRRATLDFSVDGDEAIVISIHALHEERDGKRNPVGNGQSISIHALHEESD